MLGYVAGYLGTKPVCFRHARACTRVPRYQNLLVFVLLGYAPGYLGATPGCRHARGTYPDSWVPHLVVVVMLGYVAGYLGTKPVCFRHARAYAQYPGTEAVCFRHAQYPSTRVPNLFVFVMLQYAPGCQTWLSSSYSGTDMHPPDTQAYLVPYTLLNTPFELPSVSAQ